MLSTVLGKRKKKAKSQPRVVVEEGKQTLRRAEIFVTIIAAIIPWIPSMPVVWKVFSGFVAWALLLHLVFTEHSGLSRLPLDAKIGRSVILTIWLALLVTVPIKRMWMEEQSNVLTGELCSFRSDGICYTPPHAEN